MSTGHFLMVIGPVGGQNNVKRNKLFEMHYLLHLHLLYISLSEGLIHFNFAFITDTCQSPHLYRKKYKISKRNATAYIRRDTLASMCGALAAPGGCILNYCRMPLFPARAIISCL